MTEESYMTELERRPAGRKRHGKLILLVVVLLSLLVIAIYLYPIPISVMLSWNISSIDSKGQVYEIDSARDSEGRLHVAYCGYRGLTYATSSGGGWDIYPLGFSGRYCSVAVDSEGKVHIAALAADYNRSLVYINNTLGTWEIEIVETGLWGWPIALALDSHNHAYISYSANYTIRYCTNSNDGWQSYSLGETSNGDSSTILLDSQDRIHVFTADPVRHFTNESGSWTNESIFYWDLGGDKISAALDSEGSIHIAFLGDERDITHGWGLMHGTNTNGSWTLTLVDELESFGGQECAIGLDSQDGIHISYQDFDSGRLKYALNVDGTWKITSLTKGGEGFYYRVTGNTNDMIVEPSGHVHIFYSEKPSAPLRHATDEFPPMILRLSLYVLLLAIPLVAIGIVVKLARKRAKRKDELREGP